MFTLFFSLSFFPLTSIVQLCRVGRSSVESLALSPTILAHLLAHPSTCHVGVDTVKPSLLGAASATTSSWVDCKHLAWPGIAPIRST